MRIDGRDATSVQSVRTQNNNHDTETKDNKNINERNVQVHDKNEEFLSEKSVIDAINKANKAIKGTRTQMEFSIHEKTKEIMVKVIDSDTMEVIREIPQEKILDMVAKMWEMAGILVDERR